MKPHLHPLAAAILSVAATAALAHAQPADDAGDDGDDAGAAPIPADPADPVDPVTDPVVSGEPAVESIEAPMAPAKPAPGLTLPAGKLNIAINLEINTGSDAVAKPVSIAPDISYGVNDDLTVTLVHGSFLTSGFRGAAGSGLCLTGTDNGCGKVYNNLGAEVLYSLARGKFAFAANGGFLAVNLDGGFYDLKVGGKLRYKAGKVALITSPSVFVALTKRKEMDVTVNPDRLWVPVVISYSIGKPLWVGFGTGIKGPLQKFADSYQLAVGALGQYSIDARHAVGASLIFGRINRGDAALDTSGVDYRWLQLWYSLTL